MKIEQRYRKATLALMIASALSGCNDSENPSSTPKETAPLTTTQNAENTVTAHDVQHWQAHGLNSYLSESLATWSIEQDDTELKPKENVVETKNGKIIQRGGQLVYVSQNAKTETFILKNQSASLNESITVNIAQVISDPLVAQQWHLDNTGQMGYARPEGIAKLWYRFLTDGRPRLSADMADKKIAELQAKPSSIAGEDMNVAEAYALGVTGKDTIVVVVDSGLEINHEDLEDNVLPNRSLNFHRFADSPTDPTNDELNGDHGTSVAGLIAAKGWNNLGGRGVAPDTSLIGMNLLKGQTEANNMISHGMVGSGISTSEPVVAFNRSYGRDSSAFQTYDEMDEEMTAYSANTLRDGKGALNVKSAGNSFYSSKHTGDICKHTGASEYGLTCTNSILEPDLSFNHYLAIGAVNADGTKSSYSTAGPNIFVSAPAGESGDWEPAMITPDQSTCLRGYASQSSLSARDGFAFGVPIASDVYQFDAGKLEDNLSCHYTSTFNGTSSAAPNTSGVIALIASANPSLSWRDIKHILASTSDKNNPHDPTVSIPAGNGNFVAHLGWIENGAGYHFNNHYGFGRVNAGEAVKMALDYKHSLPEQVRTSWTVGIEQDINGEAVNPIEIPDNNASGAEMIIDVADNVTIESVQFLMDIYNEEFIKDTFSRKNAQSTAGIDLAIEVTSPAGTKTVLLSSRQAILQPVQTAHSPFAVFADGYMLKDSLIAANAFYGENAKGKWKLRFLDTSAKDIAHASPFHDSYFNNKVNSLVKKANLRVIGH